MGLFMNVTLLMLSILYLLNDIRIMHKSRRKRYLLLHHLLTSLLQNKCIKILSYMQLSIEEKHLLFVIDQQLCDDKKKKYTF